MAINRQYPLEKTYFPEEMCISYPLYPLNKAGKSYKNRVYPQNYALIHKFYPQKHLFTLSTNCL